MSTSVNASFCHMSNTVPTVCCTMSLFCIISSLSVYKGANAMAEIMSIFTHKRKFFSEVMNNCLLPMKKPSRNRPTVWKKRPALTAHSKLAFCPNVIFVQMNAPKFPAFVYSATSAYISSTLKSGNRCAGFSRLAI